MCGATHPATYPDLHLVVTSRHPNPGSLARRLGHRAGDSRGVCTFNGQLRIISASHDPLPDNLDRARDILDAAC